MISATRERVPRISLASSSLVMPRSRSSCFLRRAAKDRFDFFDGVEVAMLTCSYSYYN